ncbi:DUF4870 domain-containing protein [Pseudoxanthomonas wuyuanensis]|uniref:Orotate phosphoribosyltransferase n=1 Tax=Pseudoxanthomonas wuyuanensis TaxID=1073196 RepID=A0A286D6Y3_9GAMM|nr:DUF4870 domain-containing protein [Pseudoxanthomonas wuyuanensis]SOD54412.1 hypothetical protein SAMN06296416_10416 [Pseudoxanthomonas wuyuanensis]
MSEFENLTATPPPPSGEPTAEEKQWAMFAHLSALAALFTGGLGGVVGPLIIWLIKKDTLPFVNDQGKEALNFNITVLIAIVALCIVGTILMIVLIGFLFFLLAGVVGIAWLVLTIIATIKASNGEAYRYPLTLRLIK